MFSTSIPRTREYGDIYPLDIFSLASRSRLFRFILLQPALAICATQKTRHTLCSHNSTILCRRLAILPVPCPALRLVFHIHPFHPSTLTFPRHTLPRMFFVPLPLSHCHRSPLSSSMPRPRLPVSCLPVFPPPSPSNLVVSFAHDILSIYGPSPYSPPLDGRTGRCDHMWIVHPVLFLAFPPMPSRHHFLPPTVVYLLAFL